ncbi:adhesion G-protein coupled receptor D1-like [Diadema antillarum]|uniref:adhesion G-protein coupled receptor D1-like n=1 Tax=Diadema antillarum TaxID=105358 RepID=UPI003A898702
MTYLVYQNEYIPPDQYAILKDGSARICWSQPPSSPFQYSAKQQFLGNVFNQFVSAWAEGTLVLCQLVAILSHLTFLSVFSWTNILAWDLALQFGSQKLILVSGSNRKRLAVYSGLGWGTPLLLVALCMVVHFTNPKILTYGGPSCWLEPKRANVLAFLVPVAFSLLGNVALFCWTSYGLRKSRSESTIILHRDMDDQQRRRKLRELLVYVKISCLLGLGWLFGFIAFFADLGVLWYIFIITSSLQGISIFVFFGASERVRLLWRQRCGEHITLMTTLTLRESLSSRFDAAKNCSTTAHGRPNIDSLGPPQKNESNL